MATLAFDVKFYTHYLNQKVLKSVHFWTLVELFRNVLGVIFIQTAFDI